MAASGAGVNLVGFAGGEQGQGASVRLGLGEVARRLARALEYADIPHVTIRYRAPVEEVTRQQLRGQALYDTNVICLNADYLGEFLRDAGPEFFAERTSIGVWFWETNTFRLDPWTPVACLDEIWVTSSYVREAVAAVVDLPVLVAPLPMDLPAAPVRSRAALGLPEGYLFLFAFNAVSMLRKNPMAVLEAFTRAFEPGEGPVLVLKSVNGRERKPSLFAELETAARDRPDVLLVDRYVAADESRAIVASADCYVSLHRSEGFGLTMAEAMAYGKPVIATAYSGNMEFMDARTAYLVPYRLTPVPEDWWAHVAGADWAEPDVEAAAALMRQVYGNQEQARLRGEHGREELLRRYSVDHSARFVARRLGETGRRGTYVTLGSKRAKRAIVEACFELSKGVGGGIANVGRGPKSVFRRLLLRALWPHLVEQQRLHAALVDALDGLRHSHDDIQELDTCAAASTTAPSPRSHRPERAPGRVAVAPDDDADPDSTRAIKQEGQPPARHAP